MAYSKSVEDVDRFVEDQFRTLLHEAPSFDLSFRQFVDAVAPHMQWSRLYEEMVDVFQRVVDGEIRNLVVNVPSRLGKSTWITVLGSAYNVRRHPWEYTAIAAATNRLALNFSDAARQFYRHSGGRFLPSMKSKSQWYTGLGGGLWAVGTRSQATGMGGDLLILDDPIKDHRDAESPNKQQDLRDWWDSVWMYRRNSEESRMVVITNRWPFGDLVEYLWQKEAFNPRHWYHFSLDGIAELEPYDTPHTCTLHPDWRAKGESICPERFSVKEMQDRAIGAWGRAIIQQRPDTAEMSGRVAHAFTEEKNTSEALDWIRLPDGRIRELVLGWDFNINPMCITVGQFVSGQFQYLDEFYLEDLVTATACEVIKDRYPPHTVARYVVYPDPSGKSRRTAGSAGSQSDFDALELAGFEVVAHSSAPHIRDRVNAFNMACGIGDAPPYLWVKKSTCPRLVDALLRHRYKVVDGRSIPDKTRGFDHIFDAASYWVEYEAPADLGDAGEGLQYSAM